MAGGCTRYQYQPRRVQPHGPCGQVTLRWELLASHTGSMPWSWHARMQEGSAAERPPMEYGESYSVDRGEYGLCKQGVQAIHTGAHMGIEFQREALHQYQATRHEGMPCSALSTGTRVIMETAQLGGLCTRLPRACLCAGGCWPLGDLGVG